MTSDFDDDAREGGGKGPDAFRTISEVAEELGLPQHVLRFWETRFPQIRPIKRGGGRRYYRPGDVELLRGVKQLLYGQGYTIRGVQRILRERGGRTLAQTAGAAPEAPEIRTDDHEFYAPRRAAARDVAAEPSDETDEAPFEAPRLNLEPPDPLVAAEPALSLSQPGLSESQSRRLASALEDLNACRRLLGGLT